MTLAQKQLLETLSGHFAWLQNSHPRKANKRLARRARKAVQLSLRSCNTRTMRLAA
jgi:hypothetical protein